MDQKFCFAFICGKSNKTETYFHQKFNFIIALVLSLNSSIFSMEFCTAFKENGHKISYGFEFHDQFVIVIAGQCWTLNIENIQNEYKLNLLNNESKECPLFTADYSMAVILPTQYSKSMFALMPMLFNVTII